MNYTESIIKLNDSLNESKAMIETMIAEGKENDISAMVSISTGNNKMGKIASVSLLPLLTCPACCKETCAKECYAKKLAFLRPSVMKAYARNTAIAIMKPEAYWHAIRKTVKTCLFFRFHVSGDIMNVEYFRNMIKTANENKHCNFLVFTKRFDVVNNYMKENGKLPENLHILFSGWENLKPYNPFNLPETIVYKKPEEIQDNWTPCGGNCMECAVSGVGCWATKNGDCIAFKKH